MKKPGAIKSSLVLKKAPYLKKIYDKYFNDNPKKFIKILINNKDKNIQEIINIFENYTNISKNVIPKDKIFTKRDIHTSTKLQIVRYNDLCIKKVVKNGN